MGIDARIVVYAKNRQIAERACEAGFKKIAELEAIMSDYRPDSELMRLCGKAGTGPVPISTDLYRVLDQAQRFSRQTDGEFDVTVGPLVQIWRRARKETKLPTAEEIAKAQSLVGWQKLKLGWRDGTAELSTPGMRLDLGGIAKGYASDEALKELRRFGIRSALIEMGGDLLLGEAPPKTEGWKVTVANASPGAMPAEMFLKNCAISTSGDTEQFVVIDGVRYSHVVDPKTGRGLSRRVQSSVIGPNAFLTDPLSTALTLLDERRREDLLRQHPSTKAFVKVAGD